MSPPLPLQCLLRLPACLRRQAWLDGVPPRPLSLRLDVAGSPARRAFSSTRPKLQQPKPPGTAHTKPPALPASARRPPPPSLAPNAKPLLYTDVLFASADEVLIYRAPRHRSFMITSYIAGAIALVGAYNCAALALQPPPGQEKQKLSLRGYLATIPGVITTLFLAIAGTTMILAPVKCIRSISAIGPRQSGTGLPALQCVMASPLPFMKPKIFRTLLSDAFLDRNVSAVEIDFTSIPLAQAKSFTASKQPDLSAIAAASHRGLFGRAWRTLTRDVRRMLLRDSFAYVRFSQYGNWKLDLSDCELLDNGRVLVSLTTPDPKRGVGLIAMFRRKFLV
ncbi:hypothetical protein LTR08_005639 [Meristemomyces frigidus]|nr:hypothetical protein LTR08_005639 [Meristemomyces frigidus]